MLYLYPAAGDKMIVFLLFFGQFYFLAVLIRQLTVLVIFTNTLIARISLAFYVSMYMYRTFLKHPEIMFTPFGYLYTNDAAIFAGY